MSWSPPEPLHRGAGEPGMISGRRDICVGIVQLMVVVHHTISNTFCEARSFGATRGGYISISNTFCEARSFGATRAGYLDQPRALFCDSLQKSVHFLEIHTFEQKLYFSCRLNIRHRSILLPFSTRISLSAPAMALEIVMLIPFEGVQFTKDKRCPFPQENVPLISVHFPQISVLFPPKTANSQTRQGSCHTLPHSNWRRKT